MVCYELHNPAEPQRETGIQSTPRVSFETSISIDLCKILISSWRSRPIFQSELEANIDSNVSHFLQKDDLEGLQSYPERLQSEQQPSAQRSERQTLVGPSYGCTIKHRLLTRINTRCGSVHNLNRCIVMPPIITQLQASCDCERHTVNSHLLSDPKGHLYGKHLQSVSSVWLPTARATLNITLLSVLLLALTKLIPSYKLLLKSQDASYLLALLLVAWLPAGLLHVVRRKVKANSSKTISIITVTLSCYVKLTDSAPLHLPNLMIRGTAGGNGTYTVPLQGSPNTGYCAKITIGIQPYPQEFCVLVDTGSANLAVAGVTHPDINNWFHPEQSNNYTNLGRTVSVSYTAGDWTGILSKDYIAIQGPSNTWYHSVETFFVLITKSQHFFINDADWVGILGMAYSSLAKPDSSVVTFWEALRSATGMKDMFSLQFCPPLDIPLLDITEPQGGTMVLGGLNDTLYRGPIFFTDIVEQRFYNVLVSNLTIGNTSISLDCKEFNNDQSIVDSGTTDIFFPDKVFAEVKNTFIAHFKGGRPLPVPENFWVGGTKLAWPADDKATIYGAFPSIYLGFATAGNASQEFSLVVTPQIYLRQIEGTSSEQHDTNCYPECDFFTFGIKQRERGTVIGGNVLLGFFSHFDRETQRIGFAKSTCQYQNPHDGVPEIVGPYPRIPKDCQCSNCKPGMPYWEIISYTCGSVVCPLAIISIICAFCGRRCRKQDAREENAGCWKRIAKCCRKFWKKKKISRPTPVSSEEVRRLVLLDDEGEVHSLGEASTEPEVYVSSGEERGRVPDRQDGEKSVEGSSHISANLKEEAVSKLESSRKKLADSYHVTASADTSEVVPLLQPETTQSKSELALSKHKGSSTDKQQSKKVRSGPLEEDRQRKVGWKDTTGSEPPKNDSLEQNPTTSTLPLDTESIAERYCNVPSNSNKSSTIHNSNKCHTVVEQNEAVQQAHQVDDNENEDNLNVTQSSRHTQSETKIACEPWTKFLPSSRKTDVKEVVCVQIQKPCSRDEGYCSRQTSRQDSQQPAAEDSLHSVSSRDQTCVNRQKSADSALGYVPGSESDFEEN